MNEKIDLTKILKNCPKGFKLYSLLHGEVLFRGIDEAYDYPITYDYPIMGYIGESTSAFYLARNGAYSRNYNGDCILFPSKEQRDWSKFTAPWYKKEKFDPKTLKAFDMVLARIDGDDVYCWFSDFVSIPTIEKYDLLPCIMSNKDANMIIPYNDDTKHLVGTTEEAPEYYRYWED